MMRKRRFEITITKCIKYMIITAHSRLHTNTYTYDDDDIYIEYILKIARFALAFDSVFILFGVHSAILRVEYIERRLLRSENRVGRR